MPLLGEYAVVDPTVPPGAGAVNSAQRVNAVHRRFRLAVADGQTLDGRRVLLVDDLVGTGGP